MELTSAFAQRRTAVLFGRTLTPITRVSLTKTTGDFIRRKIAGGCSSLLYHRSRYLNPGNMLATVALKSQYRGIRRWPAAATPGSIAVMRRCGWACDLLWRRLGAMGKASPLSVDKVSLL